MECQAIHQLALLPSQLLAVHKCYTNTQITGPQRLPTRRDVGAGRPFGYLCLDLWTARIPAVDCRAQGPTSPDYFLKTISAILSVLKCGTTSMFPNSLRITQFSFLDGV